jgi:hypothetical protein
MHVVGVLFTWVWVLTMVVQIVAGLMWVLTVVVKEFWAGVSYRRMTQEQRNAIPFPAIHLPPAYKRRAP